MHHIFMLLGHTILICCSELVGVIRRNMEVSLKNVAFLCEGVCVCVCVCVHLYVFVN